MDEKEVIEEVSKEVNEIDLSAIEQGNEKVVEKLDEMIQLLTPDDSTTEIIEEVPTLDYTEQLNQIADLLQQQNDALLAISEGTNTILVYGLIVVPLFIICMMLWWFFKQFLYKF